ncbi:MAG: hypothetical protein GKR96_14700 [Gammaproteobacteria bacterium]|nr:hypothetical protein [Gammaproteobacteria bacterium]
MARTDEVKSTLSADTVYFVTLQGKLFGLGKYGHMGAFLPELQVDRVVQKEAGNCNEVSGYSPNGKIGAVKNTDRIISSRG